MNVKDIKNRTSVWWGMTDAQRIAFVKDRLDKTYRQIGNEIGVAESTVGDFCRANQLDKFQRDILRRAKRLERLADLIAPMYAAKKSAPEIASELGLACGYVKTVIGRARANGDKRFPIRKHHTKPHSSTQAPVAIKEASLVEIYKALKREVHPDGTPYTMDCVFNAHSGKGHIYKQPRVSSHFSERDIANRAQLARANSLVCVEGQLA
jgi:predicted transcriptional regulator